VEIATDVGGTYTDFVVYRDGRLQAFKRITTPDVHTGVLRGLRELGRPDYFAHGTTVATNAVLERRGARVLMITTRGFRDFLRIGRQTRAKLYSFDAAKPEPLTQDVFEAEERITAHGGIEVPLKVQLPEDLSTYDSVAVCLLHSYRNPSHERELRDALLRAGVQHVSCSHEVAPVYREYERGSTTLLDAYVKPITGPYLERLRSGVGRDYYVMTSSGGLVRHTMAAERPVEMLLSGPAGGVAAAASIGIESCLTMDMGGTSTDVSALLDGEPAVRGEWNIDGLPVITPAVDMTTIGAGGGSVASVDEGGALTVGPRSAGSHPGPAAYGLGGEELTVTDALVCMGLLRDGASLSGDVALSAARARDVLRKRAGEWKLPEDEIPVDIWRVVNSNMARALRIECTRMGLDPRDHPLVVFGGQGPLHGCSVAEEVGMRRVVVPYHAGIFSALGILRSPYVIRFVKSEIGEVESTWDRVVDAHRSLMELLKSHLRKHPVDTSRSEVRSALMMRYSGQSHTIEVPMPSSPEEAAALFREAHRRYYGFSLEDIPCEAVDVRITYIGHRSAPDLPLLEAAERSPETRRIPLEDGPVAVFRGRGSCPGLEGEGPALFEEETTTVYIPSGWRFEIDRYGTLEACR